MLVGFGILKSVEESEGINSGGESGEKLCHEWKSEGKSELHFAQLLLSFSKSPNSKLLETPPDQSQCQTKS